MENSRNNSEKECSQNCVQVLPSSVSKLGDNDAHSVSSWPLVIWPMFSINNAEKSFPRVRAEFFSWASTCSNDGPKYCFCACSLKTTLTELLAMSEMASLNNDDKYAAAYSSQASSLSERINTGYKHLQGQFRPVNQYHGTLRNIRGRAYGQG